MLWPSKTLKMLQLPALESLIAKFVVRTPLLRSLVAPVSNWYMGATTARKYGNCRIEEPGSGLQKRRVGMGGVRVGGKEG